MRFISSLCGRRVELCWLLCGFGCQKQPLAFSEFALELEFVWVPPALARLLLMAQHVMHWGSLLHQTCCGNICRNSVPWDFCRLVTRTTGFISREAHNLFKKAGSYLLIEEYWFWKVVNISACWVTWEVKTVQLKGKRSGADHLQVAI